MSEGNENHAPALYVLGTLVALGLSITTFVSRTYTKYTGIEGGQIFYEATRFLQFGKFDPGQGVLDARDVVSKFKRDRNQATNSVLPETNLLCAIHAGEILITSLSDASIAKERGRDYSSFSIGPRKMSADTLEFVTKMQPLLLKAQALHNSMIEQRLGYPYKVDFDHLGYHPSYPQNIFVELKTGEVLYKPRDMIEDTSVGVSANANVINSYVAEFEKVLKQADLLRQQYKIEIMPAEKALQDYFYYNVKDYPAQREEYENNPGLKKPKPRIEQLERTEGNHR